MLAPIPSKACGGMQNCHAHLSAAKKHFLGYLATFMLRRKFENEPDAFATFMRSIAQLYSEYDFTKDIPESDFVCTQEEIDSILHAEVTAVLLDELSEDEGE